MHLYIHIPFCKQACHYCDFHFSTNTASKRAISEAIAKEIILRKNYLPEGKLETIYFGGGTPSILDQSELELILDTVKSHFAIADDAEVTLEANPDDLNPEKIRQISDAGINRLSIGIQSFHEPHLKYLNRAHSSLEAEKCVQEAQNAGIDNISIDLIYAIPADNHDILRSDIAKVTAMGIPHVSAYCLTIEPQTAFGKWLKTKKIQPIDEEFAATQFEILIETLAQNNFEQYEISNFAANEKYSRHNSSYWKSRPYLGVGPSAHSFNGISREYNISNNANYLKAIARDEIPSTVEILTLADKTNEYLLTGLRTKWGVDINILEQLSGGRFSEDRNKDIIKMKAINWLDINGSNITLTQKGKLFADKISADLFID